jgi:hypothetical protein
MLPPRTRLDPEGFYAILGLDPAATPEAITAAFRRQARIVHPDVPATGDAKKFVAVRQAYDVLSNRERRKTYDQGARHAVANAWTVESAQTSSPNIDPADWYAAEFSSHPAREARPRAPQRTLFAGIPVAVWVGLGAFLCLCVVEAGLHLRSPPMIPSAGIKPNAAPVTPLSPSAQRAELYGPTPVRLPGTPNFYIVPAAGAAVLWRKDAKLDSYVPIGQLPPFSSVQAVRLYRQSGLVEVLFNETSTGFVDSNRLAPGDAETARRAYCGYNAGAPPYDGELLQQRDQGNGTIQLDNRTIRPVVVKLRDPSGVAALSVFLGPRGHAELTGVPGGIFRPDFAIGELWSRACSSFAAGMSARRMGETVNTLLDAYLVVPPDDEAAAADVSDTDFSRD